MYLSIEQIEQSMGRLARVHPFYGMSFLAFKQEGIPVGKSVPAVFSHVAGDVLNRFYRLCSTYEGFYNPFLTSDRQKRWVAPRYVDTSLQRITVDTFGDAFIHPKYASSWGWAKDYVARLTSHLQGARIPAFDLAVWLFRETKWPAKVDPTTVRDKLTDVFRITRQESRALFDPSIPKLALPWVSRNPVSESEMLGITGHPPGVLPGQGAALRLLAFKQTGPARRLVYEPADRLNVLTGDNGLGKTFILECCWWALTGQWLDLPAIPRKRTAKRAPQLRFVLSPTKKRTREFVARFDWDMQVWEVKPSRSGIIPGLVVYARFDGSFAVWDPARAYRHQGAPSLEGSGQIFFTRENIWNGIERKGLFEKEEVVCNGLIRDWVAWQTGGDRYEERYKALVACLKALSPSRDEPLEPGEPTRLSLDAREVPTLRMPYGEVPVIHGSAGVQRAIALAYVLVWAWYEHLENSKVIRRNPQRKLVLMIDEVEAHLHPRWQRVIVPSLLDVVRVLSAGVLPQIHIATHSPLILTSLEGLFSEETDALYHLELVEDEVRFDRVPFIKRGRADLWLISSVFGLTHPRSVEAEQAIESAKSLQMQQRPSVKGVRNVNDLLIRCLAQDDDFWPRWRFFAQQHGVE